MTLFLGFKKGSKERTFGFSFLKLLQDDSTVIKNMHYDLLVYKVSFGGIDMKSQLVGKVVENVLTQFIFPLFPLSLSIDRPYRFLKNRVFLDGPKKSALIKGQSKF